jgi:hypothetical protein
MAPALFRVPRNGIPTQVTGILVGVNGDFLSLAVPGAKPFTPFPLGFVMARPLRGSRSRGLREAGQAACAEGPPSARQPPDQQISVSSR